VVKKSITSLEERWSRTYNLIRHEIKRQAASGRKVGGIEMVLQHEKHDFLTYEIMLQKSQQGRLLLCFGEE
jgi:hypothetical protein